MKLKRISLNENQDILSREEMKKIMAGSGSGSCSGKCYAGDGSSYSYDCITLQPLGNCGCNADAYHNNCKASQFIEIMSDLKTKSKQLSILDNYIKRK